MKAEQNNVLGHTYNRFEGLSISAQNGPNLTSISRSETVKEVFTNGEVKHLEHILTSLIGHWFSSYDRLSNFL